MESGPLHLCELVCARVCHDLAGLVGTLAGTLQLAQEDVPGDGSGEAVALAREVADALARRLRLIRAALGPVADPLAAPDIADLAAGMGERLHVDVSGLGSEPLPPALARLALAMLLLGAEALPLGGTLHLAAGEGGALCMTPVGPRAAWPPGIAQGIAGTLPDTPRGLLAPLSSLLARAAGFVLATEDAPPLLRATPLRPSPDLTIPS